MKKAIYIISLILACFLISCEDFLEAPSQSTLDESLIFSNPTLASMAVDGIKEPLGQTNSYRGRFIPFYGANTDIEWNNSSDGTGPTQELARYENSATNTYMNTTNNAWAMMYLGIERANICIRGLRTYGDPAPGNEMGQLLGEALTLRSIYYADLLKAWGDVVARFEPVSSTTIYLAKSSRDDVYKQVIADLEEAATLVAWPNETEATTSTERINRAFVKALRARLILRAAGYSQYPDGIRRSNDPELSVAALYPIALQECKDFINSRTAQLESTFERVFRLMCEEDITAAANHSGRYPLQPAVDEWHSPSQCSTDLSTSTQASQEAAPSGLCHFSSMTLTLRTPGAMYRVCPMNMAMLSMVLPTRNCVQSTTGALASGAMSGWTGS